MDLFVSYQKLYRLSKEQKNALKEDDYDHLLEILNQKKKLMNTIEQVNMEEYFKKQEDPEDVLNNLQILLARIKELDAENQKNLQKNKNILGDKMFDLNVKGKIRKGYRGEKIYEAKFIDKER